MKHAIIFAPEHGTNIAVMTNLSMRQLDAVSGMELTADWRWNGMRCEFTGDMEFTLPILRCIARIARKKLMAISVSRRESSPSRPTSTVRPSPSNMMLT